MKTDVITRHRARSTNPRHQRLSRGALFCALLVAGVGAGCGGGGGNDEDGRSADAESVASSDDQPSGAVPLAPFNNPEVDDPDAIGSRRAAMPPGQWFEFEGGYFARIESVRAAKAGEVEVEATGGGASVINLQVHYDGDEATSSRSRFRLDTTLFNEALCADKGAGYDDITMSKGETVNIPYCAHLEDGGNGVALFSYVDNSQSWGAWYAIIGPDGVIEPSTSPEEEDKPGF